MAVINTETGQKLTGEEAPLASQLEAWLADHPNYERVPVEEEEEDEVDLIIFEICVHMIDKWCIFFSHLIVKLEHLLPTYCVVGVHSVLKAVRFAI